MSPPLLHFLRLLLAPARAASILALLAFLSGCTLLPKAESDPTKFYVLASPSSVAPTAPAAGAPVVHLRAPELATYLNSRALIVRKGDNELEFREYARWGEPLEQGIARVLREELLARGAVSAVTLSGVRAAGRVADFDLSIRVLACEGATHGGVNFRAIWEVTAPGDAAKLIARGDFSATGLHWNSKSEASLAAALSQAIAQLAAEIAPALKK